VRKERATFRGGGDEQGRAEPCRAAERSSRSTSDSRRGFRLRGAAPVIELEDEVGRLRAFADGELLREDAHALDVLGARGAALQVTFDGFVAIASGVRVETKRRRMLAHGMFTHQGPP